MTKEAKLCECGCGGYTSPGKKYIRGHNLRVNNPMKNPETIKKMIKSNKDQRGRPKPEPKLCACGCGEYAKPGNRFINGHVQVGVKHTKEACENMRVGQIKRNKDPLEREKQRERTKKRMEDPLEREKLRVAQNKRWEDPSEHEKIKEAQLKRWEDPKEHEKASERTNKRFEDPIEHEKLSAGHQHIPYEEWESFASEQRYCPDFNEECKESNRDKYDRVCFLTGLSEEENMTSAGKQQKLSVHHVDMDKGQGCDDKRWKLVPLCMGWHNKVHNKLWEYRIIWLLNNVWNNEDYKY